MEVKNNLVESARQRLYYNMLDELELEHKYFFGIIGFAEQLISKIKNTGYITLNYLELNNKISEKFKEYLEINGKENVTNEVIELHKKIYEEQKKNNFEYVNVSIL